MAEQKVKLTVSQILEDLNNGLDRKAIREKYNLTATDVARLFQHEKLKGVRVRTAPAFELEDDTVDEAPKAKPAAKKAAPKSQATGEVKEAAQEEVVTETPTATATTATEEVVEEEEAKEEVVDNTPNSTGINEVKGDDEEAAETTKGLW